MSPIRNDCPYCNDRDFDDGHKHLLEIIFPVFLQDWSLGLSISGKKLFLTSGPLLERRCNYDAYQTIISKKIIR